MSSTANTTRPPPRAWSSPSKPRAMFAAALIVFRESLEAALFVGIVAAATRELAGRARWLAGGVGIGVLGAILLALSAHTIGELFDGVGQDLVNIVVLSVALTMLL